MEKVKRLEVLDPLQMSKLQEQFAHLQPLLAQRPIVLLRHLAEIPWLLERGFKALAERNITALQASLKA